MNKPSANAPVPVRETAGATSPRRKRNSGKEKDRTKKEDTPIFHVTQLPYDCYMSLNDIDAGI